ncbi:MAG: BtpA/SgcQ family protein [Bacillota bacterium]
MWIEELFKTSKPVIGMLHLHPLPGDPNYDEQKNMEYVVRCARHDLHALQNGGIDAVLVCNEFSLPWLYDVEPSTLAAMGRVIGELKSEFTVPFGVDVAIDPYKVFDLAVAVNAPFARQTFTGAYAGDFGILNYEIGKIHRHRARVGAKNVRTFFTLVPECGLPLANRPIEEVAISTEFYGQPDVYLVCGLIAGCEPDAQIITRIKKVCKTPVFANTGVRLENVELQLGAADGCIVGTSLKRDGQFYNEVDEARVAALMEKARRVRG